MAVVEYCAVRKLDPYKRPVSIVPMYNSRLCRKVQVVMQGINEVEIVASRTGQWAGMDAPEWGPEMERTFRGSFEKDDGSTVNTEVTLTYPEWCRVTVYRLVGGQRAAFTEQLWWEESYGRAGFRSEVPNARWQQARRQMIHKCTKAAVLRAAFPEDATYTAEEMDGHETDGGFTIDGVAEPGAESVRPAATNGSTAPARAIQGGGVRTAGPASSPAQRQAAQERQAATVYATLTVAEALESEPDPGKWMVLVERLAGQAADLTTLHEIATHYAVRDALTKAPTLIAGRLREALRLAHERLAEPADLLSELLAEVAAMDGEVLNGLASNPEWLARTQELFPGDAERLDEEIAVRKAEANKETTRAESSTEASAGSRITGDEPRV
jgi:phage recombination protein Bet